MNSKYKFITVEGFDGSGKSSIAKLISEKYSYKYLKTPMNAFSRAREHFDDTVELLERLSFYLGSCLSASLEIEKELDSNRLIVLDRYFYSTIAYHQAKLGYIPKAINNILPFLQKPDLILYIKTNFQLTIERLNLRGLSMNDKLFLNEEHYDKIHLNYLNSFNVKYFIVDNTKDIQCAEETINLLLEN
ncbi:MAG: deoxynucleoside kinase [Leptospiraceae bacterium]|jgi:thymidylate kinase|nr:deoxynucleoside kinase [Leptospiraceae bacterium]